MSDRRLILASASPRRRELLSSLGLDFEVTPSTVDEAAFLKLMPGASPSDIVLKLAETKALDVASRTVGDALVIGADTDVALDGDVLGKPESEQQAVDMLLRLSGRVHQVYTAITLVDVQQSHIARHATSYCATDVEFSPFDEARASAYVATGEPMDKAGSYGIQALGTLLIPRISGDYFNVVGLPLFRLGEMLAEFGYAVL